MKKYLLLGLLLAGCSGTVSNEEMLYKSLEKTVCIKVESIVKVTSIDFSDGGITVSASTQTVTIEGAGVLVSPYGHVLTVAHLFTFGHPIAAYVETYDHRISSFPVPIGIDAKKDLAMIKINRSNTPYIVLASTIALGERVWAIGSPASLHWSVSSGIISQIRDNMFGVTTNLIQTDTSINPGNSGGPLINRDGELVGINSFKIVSEDGMPYPGLNFSVSIKGIRDFLRRYKGIPN